MASQQRKNAEGPEEIDALVRQSDTLNANVADTAAAHGAQISEESNRLARLYLPPLARLFELSPRFDELIGGRWLHDPVGWRQEVASVLQVLRDAKLRLQAIEPATRMAIRSLGGHRGVVTAAAAELSTKAGEAYNRRDGVKTGLQKAISIMGERMLIYGTDYSELGLTDEEKAAFVNHIDEKINKPKSPRSRAGGDSRAVSLYVEPIQGVERALERSDIIEIARELGRLSAHIVERLERRSAELDAITCRGPAVDAAQSRELAQRNFDLTLESMRLPLIDLAIAGILRCFGGQQRLAMELECQQYQQSEEPAPPRVQEILDRLSEGFISRSKTNSAESDE